MPRRRCSSCGHGEEISEEAGVPEPGRQQALDSKETLQEETNTASREGMGPRTGKERQQETVFLVQSQDKIKNWGCQSEGPKVLKKPCYQNRSPMLNLKVRLA